MTNNDNRVASLLAAGSGNVHMVGVCGVGMAGLAVLLKARGFNVSGCDTVTGSMADWLAERKIPVAARHDEAHINDQLSFVIRTPAVSADEPEIALALEEGVPVLFRGEVLPELLKDKSAIAVCGTHGKTTTATFITQILHSIGEDPSWCIGGEADNLGGVAGSGRGKAIVVEADESDGTLSLYSPDITLITNVEYDHMENFGSADAMEECFKEAVGNTSKSVIYCKDDEAGTRIAAAAGEKSVSFGFNNEADYSASMLQDESIGESFVLHVKGQDLGKITIPVTGRHNVLNALGAISVINEYGIDMARIKTALKNISLPKRRFETIAESGGIKVISDYAHHPTEIAAALDMAKAEAKRIIAVYEPHRYTRTLALGKDFPPSFKGIDELVLVPVYAASESPLPGSSIWDLYEHFVTYQETLEEGDRYPCVSVARTLDKAWSYIKKRLLADDILMVMGAGTVEKIAYMARDEFQESVKQGGLQIDGIQNDYDIGTRTTFGAGGTADCYIEVKSKDQLVAALSQARDQNEPITVIGAGSNMVISDQGIRGLTVKLGECFKGISNTDGLLKVGASVSLSRLLDYAEQAELSGLEFLEGIPGTVGGAVKMNAGAYEKEIFDSLVSIDYITGLGELKTVEPTGARFGYRNSMFGSDAIVLEVLFRLQHSESSEIAKIRKALAEKRSWYKGLRCAGSVFRNPEGEFAGKLIEEAGLKGYRIGGASVSHHHANVIKAEKNARATDIIALIEKMKSVILHKYEIELKSEVVIID